MNPLRTFCLLACLLTVALANQKHGNSLKPSEWLSHSDLESLSSVEQMTLNDLAKMPAEQGARLVQKVYHISQLKNDLTPSFVPSPSNVPAYIIKSNGEKVSANLNNLVSKIKQEQPNFGNEEVTLFITGLPQTNPSVVKANRNLIQAYIQRYSGQQNRPNSVNVEGYDNDNKNPSSSEEDYNESYKTPKANKGNLIVIDLGQVITNFKRYALLDIEETGSLIAKVLIELTNELDVPHEIVHMVAQGISAHVAGAAAREFTRQTGHQLRRITALDPSNILARKPKTLTGLARGDADFVDAIHTSARGMGTQQRVGDIDFFPNGPSPTMPGTDNVVESSMRATRYFAESVRPGNERNFPAVAANSLHEYENNNGYGKRTYMGIAADFDLEGDYMLQVNAKSPFGKSSPAQKQNSYHSSHKPWRNNQN